MTPTPQATPSAPAKPADPVRDALEAAFDKAIVEHNPDESAPARKPAPAAEKDDEDEDEDLPEGEEQENDEADDEQETEDDEEDDDDAQGALSAADRARHIRTLRSKKVSMSAIVALDDARLAEMAEAMSEVDGDQDDEDESVLDNDLPSPRTPKGSKAAMRQVREVLGDEAADALDSVLSPVTRGLQEVIGILGDRMRSEEAEQKSAARDRLRREFPALRKGAAWKELDQKVLRLARTGEYRSARDVQRLYDDAATLLGYRPNKKGKAHSDTSRKGELLRDRGSASGPGGSGPQARAPKSIEDRLAEQFDKATSKGRHL